MSDKKKESDVLVAGGADKYNPIRETISKAGVKMPDMVAHGNMTIVNSNNIEEEPLTLKEKKKISLPQIGEKFMLGGHEYKVVYINPGQHRFSCEPCRGVY